MKRIHTMRSRMILFTVLLSVGILGAVGVFSCWYISSTLTKNIIREYTAEMDQVAIHLRYLQREIQQFATEIASDPVIQQAIDPDGTAMDATALIRKKKELARNLRDYMTQKSDILGIDLVFTDGWSATTDTTSTSAIIDSMDDLTWYNQFIASGDSSRFLSPVFVQVGRNTRQPSMVYLLRCNNYLLNRTHFATLIIYFRPDLITGQIHNAFAGAALVSLLDKNGIPLYTQGMAENDDKNTIALSTGQLEDEWTLSVQVPKSSALHQVYYVIGIVIAGMGALLLLIITLAIPMIGRWTRPLRQMTQAAQRIAGGELELSLEPSGEDEIGELSHAFSVMSGTLQRQIAQIKQDEKIRTELQMDLLMAKINPHFIYNTLDSAICLAQMGRCRETAELCRLLVRILQDTLHAEGEQAIAAVEDELSNVRDYVQLQSLRYPRRFSVAYNIQPEALHAHLPRLTLQPLVENALFHGILVSEMPGMIMVDAILENNILRVHVQDTGAGMTEERCLELLSSNPTRSSAQMRSIGLQNIRDRLALIYKDHAELILQSTPGKGTCVTLLLPQDVTAFLSPDENAGNPPSSKDSPTQERL